MTAVPAQPLSLAVVRDTPTTLRCFVAATNGLFLTTDEGQQWQFCFQSHPPLHDVPCSTVATAPAGTGAAVILAGVPGGIARSSNGGDSWEIVSLQSPPPIVSSIVFSPAFSTDNTVCLSTLEDGVWVSNDGGQTWMCWSAGLFDQRVLDLCFSPSYEIDSTIYAATASGLYLSQNQGRRWVPLPGLPTLQGIERCCAIHAEDGDATLVILTEPGELMAGSPEDGWTWASIHPDEATPVHHLFPVGGTIAGIVTSRSVALTTNGGRSWSGLDAPLSAIDSDWLVAGTLAPETRDLTIVGIGPDGQFTVITP